MAEEITRKVYALIPAAGSGVRFGSSENKVFAPLLGRPLLGWTLQAFADCDAVDAVIVIGSEADLLRLREIGDAYGGGKVVDVVTGGDTRQESVRLGLNAVPETVDYIVVHDAARCCVTSVDLMHLRFNANNGITFSYYRPISDTLVRGGKSSGWSRDMGENVPRDNLCAIQTPQGFAREDLVNAHAQAVADGFIGTDDAALAQRTGIDVRLFAGSLTNIKVTYGDDLMLAKAILARRQYTSAIRVGHGYDVHQFAEGRELWLGGVHFAESPVGLLGHSDADALLHAVCDALLGAAGMGDIGVLFPPSDDRHKDRRSIEFLDEVKTRLDAEGWRVGNVDISVLAEMPKIAPRAGTIREVIAVSLGISADAVSVKATTNEKMGFVGRGEGIAVHATVLIHR